MAFNFPTPTEDGQQVTNPDTGSTYTWMENPGKWVLTITPGDGGDTSGLEGRVSDLETKTLANEDDIADNAEAIEALEQRPVAKEYMIGTDATPNSFNITKPVAISPQIELVDSEGFYSNVKIIFLIISIR